MKLDLEQFRNLAERFSSMVRSRVSPQTIIRDEEGKAWRGMVGGAGGDSYIGRIPEYDEKSVEKKTGQ